MRSRSLEMKIHWETLEMPHDGYVLPFKLFDETTNIALDGVNGTDIPLREFGFRANQVIEGLRAENPDKEFTESDYRAALGLSRLPRAIASALPAGR